MSRPSRTAVRILSVAIAALAALALAACGDDEGAGEAGPGTATLVPGGVPIYLDAVVRPEGEQLDGLLSAIGTISGQEDPGGLLPAAIDEGLSEQGLSYEDDISPWLGSDAGGFLLDFDSEPSGALILSVTDTDAAQEAVDRLAEADDVMQTATNYEGVDYTLDDDDGAFGFVGDYLVAGTDAGFKAVVDASNGESLADDTEAADALASAPEESLFIAYIDTPRLFDELVGSGVISRQDLDTAAADQAEALEEGPIVLSGAATADSFSIEASGPVGVGISSDDLIGALPAESWLALGVPSIGEAISGGYDALVSGFEGGLEDAAQSFPGGTALPGPTQLPDIEAELQRQLGLDLNKDLDWAGDMALFVQGSSAFNIGAGITIESSDDDAAADTLNQLGRALGRQPGLRVSRTAEGFQVIGADTPVGAEVALRDGTVVVAFLGATVDDVLSPAQMLSGSGSYEAASAALGEEIEPQFFLDFPPIISLVENLGQGADPQFQQAKPVLESLAYLAGGSADIDDRTVSRLILGLREGGGSAAPAAAITP